MGPCGCQTRSAPSGSTVLVIDASVLAVALIDDGPDGDALRDRLRGQALVVGTGFLLLTTGLGAWWWAEERWRW